jgi:hypothetical protein
MALGTLPYLHKSKIVSLANIYISDSVREYGVLHLGEKGLKEAERVP